MNDFKSNFITYWKSNNLALSLFIGISFLFFLINYLAFFEGYVSVDMILTMIYLVVAPGFITYITFNNVHLQLYFVLNKRSFWPLLINSITPLLISIVFTTCYAIITMFTSSYAIVYSDSYQFLIMHLISIPFILYAMIIVFEKKYQESRNLKSNLKVIGILVSFLFLALINQLINNDWVNVIIGVSATITMFYILPLYYVIKKYRKVDA